MNQQTVRRIVWAAAYIGLAVDVGTVAIVVPAWTGHPLAGAFVTTTATALMVATLALQVTFLIMQIFPNGRAMVPVPMLGYDGWIFVISSTGIPGVLWYNLAAQAAPVMRLTLIGMGTPTMAIASAFITPVFTCLLLVVFRGTLQGRRQATHVVV